MSNYTATALMQTTNFAPCQWEVQALPKPLYIRYRWGWLRVRLLDADLYDDLLAVPHGEEFDSTLETSEMMRLTAGLIDWSRLEGKLT